MKHPKLAAACAGATVVATTMAYQGVEYVAIPGVGIELPANIMQMLLPLLAFFLPSLLGKLFPNIPGLSDLLLKILQSFWPDLKPPKASEAVPQHELINRASVIASSLADQGDLEAVKCACTLHQLLLQRAIEQKQDQPTPNPKPVEE